MKHLKLFEEFGNKIDTAECIEAVVDYFKNKAVNANSPLVDPKQWKRLSKTGSGTIKREFENRVNGIKMYVKSTDIEILEVSEVDFTLGSLGAVKPTKKSSALTNDQKEAIKEFEESYNSIDLSKGFGWYIIPKDKRMNDEDKVEVCIFPLSDETSDLDMGSAVEIFIGEKLYRDKFDEVIATCFAFDGTLEELKEILNSNPIFHKRKYTE